MTSSKTKNIRSKRKARKTRKIRGGTKRGRNVGSNLGRNVGSNLGKRMRDNKYSSWFEKSYQHNPIFRKHIDEANELNRQSELSMTMSNQARWEQGEDERQIRRYKYIL